MSKSRKDKKKFEGEFNWDQFSRGHEFMEQLKRGGPHKDKRRKNRSDIKNDLRKGQYEDSDDNM